jgi:hypothetical protein
VADLESITFAERILAVKRKKIVDAVDDPLTRDMITISASSP